MAGEQGRVGAQLVLPAAVLDQIQRAGGFSSGTVDLGRSNGGQEERQPYHYAGVAVDSAEHGVEGVLVVLNSQTREVAPFQRQRLEDLAELFGAMLDREAPVPLRKALGQRDALLKLIARAGEGFLARSTWQSSATYLLVELGRVLDLDWAEIVSADEDVYVSWCHERGNKIAVSSLLSKESAAPWRQALERGESVRTDRGSMSEAGKLGFAEEGSLVLVPVRRDGSFWGVIASGVAREGRRWTELEMEVLHLLAQLLGAALTREAQDAELREGEERFAVAFRVHPMAVAIISRKDGRCLNANFHFTRMTGVSSGDLINEEHLAARLRTVVSDENEWIRMLADEPTVRNMEGRLTTPEGEERDVLLHSEHVRMNGQPCLLLMLSDITERARLQRRLLEAGERSRRRVGFDLHEDLGQHLAAISMLIGSLVQLLHQEGSSHTGLAEQIEARLKSVIDVTRHLSLELSPVGSMPEGLMDALADLVLRIEAEHDLACIFEMPVPVLVSDSSRALQLYAIAEEAAQNAAHHAEASTIQIRLTQTDDALRLAIADDGKGVPADILTSSKGTGLRMMRYRADIVGASLDIGRAASGGTEVVCLLSLDEDLG